MKVSVILSKQWKPLASKTTLVLRTDIHFMDKNRDIIQNILCSYAFMGHKGEYMM